MYRSTINNFNYQFEDLKAVLAKASPFRSGDVLAGVAAKNYEERVAAQFCLADIPLKTFLTETIIPYETDEITRLIIDDHDAETFSSIAHLTVGGFRDWLLLESTDSQTLALIKNAVTPEMAAAVSKLMRNQDLILVASKCEVITSFRNTIGRKGRLSTRLQPNHPNDDTKGILASVIDGLMYGSGDAVIGINPATDNPETCAGLLHLLNDLIQHFNIPTQSCVLSHITTTIGLIEQKVPVDLIFQSIGGTEKLNRSFGIDIALLKESFEAGQQLDRGTVGKNFMYFETGQGSALSANAHFGADQQTLEARAYALAKKFNPLLVNSVVGFIGPEYLYNGKQITRAALEDHFCGKLLGLPMGLDICYTNHTDADQDDMDNVLVLTATAGCNFIMGVPGADDVMLNYQSTSFHDALFVRKLLGLRPAPEFENWLIQQNIYAEGSANYINQNDHPLLNYVS